MKEQLINQLIQFIISILGIVSSYVLVMVGKYFQSKKDKLQSEGKADDYNRALQIAKGIFYVLEDEFKDVAKSGEQKKVEMDNRLLAVIPQLTQEELDAINKTIWNEFNKDVITPIVTPITVSLADPKPVKVPVVPTTPLP